MTAQSTARALRLAWAAAVTIAVAGVVAFAIAQTRIAGLVAENTRDTAQLQRDEHVLAGSARLEEQRASLRAMIAHRLLDTNPARLVARFLRDGAAIAARHHATISAVTSAAQFAPAPPAERAGRVATLARRGRTGFDDAADAPVLDVTIDGRYGDVLAVVRKLSAIDVPASIDVSSMTRKSADAADVSVAAVLRVVLLREGSLRASSPSIGVLR